MEVVSSERESSLSRSRCYYVLLLLNDGTVLLYDVMFTETLHTRKIILLLRRSNSLVLPIISPTGTKSTTVNYLTNQHVTVLSQYSTRPDQMFVLAQYVVLTVVVQSLLAPSSSSIDPIVHFEESRHSSLSSFTLLLPSVLVQCKGNVVLPRPLTHSVNKQRIIRSYL